MNAPNWETLATRFNAAAAKLAPDFGRNRAGVIRRLVKPDCRFCGRTDFIHSIECKKAGSSWGNTRIAYGNAVIRAAERVKAWRALGELKANLSAYIATHGLVSDGSKWVMP